MEGLSSWEGQEKLIWLAMDDKLLGGLMNSLAACALDETIRIPLSLPTSLHRLSGSAQLRLLKLGVVQLLVKQLSLLPHLRMFSIFKSSSILLLYSVNSYNSLFSVTWLLKKSYQAMELSHFKRMRFAVNRFEFLVCLWTKIVQRWIFVCITESRSEIRFEIQSQIRSLKIRGSCKRSYLRRWFWHQFPFRPSHTQTFQGFLQVHFSIWSPPRSLAK